MIGLTRAERILDIRTRIDNHIADHGDRPSADCLAVWADIILREELTDMNADKMTNTEYPFMSERQFQRRHS
ncbi:hypothetical protein EEL31_03505 [Brevibacillus laterosporus]|nr:hypothetical protein [Brevibacillus laterosporus]TPG73439.1 hypothetical protein EEL31_03505 [Brevibacillus laterosporus]